MTYKKRLRRELPTRFHRFLLIFTVLPFIAGILLNNQCTKPHAWIERSADLRQQMRNILTLPTERIPLNAVVHRFIEDKDYKVEMITYASEPNSRVTALLYLPENIDKPAPSIVVACGHGGSKSCFYAQYAGQLYSRLGYGCLVVDTIGEEEREATGRMGARGHDLYYLGDKNPEFIRTKLKRMVLGKIVWDLMRGIDYLETRKEVDKDCIGIVGYSLGGATAGCVAILDERVRASVICGWTFRGRYSTESKYCTRMPYARFKKIMRFDEMTALLAPNAATLFICGTKDSVIDRDGGATMVHELKINIEGAKQILAEAKVNGTIEAEFVPEAGHRPFFLSRAGVSRMQKYLMPAERRRQVPAAAVSFGEWVDSHGKSIEKLYNTEKNERGLQAVDYGAVLREPKELACFPERDKPEPEYTMQGWVKATVEANQRKKVLPKLMRWLEPQIWERDSEKPVVELSSSGSFDDMHIFAPCVVFENNTFFMWYCGSRGGVAQRVFKLGYALSSDGIHFKKSRFSPVFEFGDGKHSVLTPTLLRSPDGTLLREHGILRMWFAAADLTQTSALHTLHETTSDEGIHWSSPSKAQLENIYAPTIIKENGKYRMWYTDVSSEPWTIRYARSTDGKNWGVTEKPVIVIDQGWEMGRLFYTRS